jgi:hypothetical protein
MPGYNKLPNRMHRKPETRPSKFEAQIPKPKTRNPKYTCLREPSNITRRVTPVIESITQNNLSGENRSLRKTMEKMSVKAPADVGFRG